jgi:hypothetical protein
MNAPGWVRATGLLVATLAVGAVMGSAYERRRAEVHASPTGEPHMLNQLTRELDLDAAQRDSLAAILARHQSEVDSVWRVVHPQMRSTLDATMREITATLRPDQVARFHEVMRSQHAARPH